jgi:hypothetical protein
MAKQVKIGSGLIVMEPWLGVPWFALYLAQKHRAAPIRAYLAHASHGQATKPLEPHLATAKKTASLHSTIPGVLSISGLNCGRTESKQTTLIASNASKE